MKTKNLVSIAMLLLFGVVSRGQNVILTTSTGSTPGALNTFVGPSAGNTTATGLNNTLIGAQADQSITTGQNNAAIGYRSLWKNTSGSHNIAISFSSLLNNTTGSSNIALGTNALNLNLIGSSNIAFGASAGYFSTGNHNYFVGEGSGFHLASGNNNNFSGYYAGHGTSSGSDNLFIGYQAGYTPALNLHASSRNTYVGYQSGYGMMTGNFNTFIGTVKVPNSISTTTVAGTDTRNSIILADGEGFQRLYIHGGDSADTKRGNTGIGLGDNQIPQNRLEINGGIANTTGLRFRGLNGTTAPVVASNGRVLTVNANGDVILVNDAIGTGSGSSTIITQGTNINVSPYSPTTGYTISSPYQTLSQSGNIVTLTNGGSFTLPTFTDTDSQTLSLTGNTLSISNGNNVTLPLLCNIYNCDGTLTGNRTVTMSNNNLIFNTSGGAGGRIYIGNTTAFSTANFPTTTGDYRLYVEGGILTEKVKVAMRNTSDWADYVFGNDYKLMSLNEVESFIKENDHLPGIDSATDLVKKGLDLADMQAKQMGKIEELTLYTIDQQKQLDQQAKEIKELKALVKVLLEKR